MTPPDVRYRYGALLLSLVGVYIITPMTGASESHDLFMEAPLAILIAFCLLSVTVHNQQRLIAAVFVIPIVTTTVLSVVFEPSDALHVVLHLSCIAFFSCVMLMHLRVLVHSGEVNEDILAGSVCIYLLFGLVFGFIYSLLNIVDGPAFRALGTDALYFSDFVYVSMVTLTTVGYGDIVPITPIARSLSTFQALLGQFYLAIVVARFVGLYAASHNQSGKL